MNSMLISRFLIYAKNGFSWKNWIPDYGFNKLWRIIYEFLEYLIIGLNHFLIIFCVYIIIFKNNYNETTFHIFSIKWFHSRKTKSELNGDNFHLKSLLVNLIILILLTESWISVKDAQIDFRSDFCFRTISILIFFLYYTLNL